MTVLRVLPMFDELMGTATGFNLVAPEPLLRYAEAMKVLLISANATHAPHPVYPLGLDYLVGALTPRHEVHIWDVNLAGSEESLETALCRIHPEVIGLSIRNIDNVDAGAAKSFIPGYERTVRLIRRCTGAPIVLGGSGFSIFPGELISRLGADFGVVGEGEQMAPLLEALETGADPAGLPGVVLPGGPVGDPVPWMGDVDRRMRSRDAHRLFYLERGGILNLQTKRGCPFRCIYCTYPHIEGRRMRLVPPDEVAREARQLQEMGARFLFITDSAFNADVDHSLAVARAFRRVGLTIPWGAFLSPMRPPDGYYSFLAEAGLTHAEFGTESLCDSQLQRYGKPFGVKEALAAHAAARRAGVNIAHYFLLGGPGENARSVEETLNRMEELDKTAFFLFCGMRIFPHTPLYDLAIEEGQVEPDQELLRPVFYRSAGIAPEAIAERVRMQARGRVNWVCGDGGETTDRVVARMHSRGHAGPLWELLLR
ncbi:MAG: radical SAM protein [Deltaproteobacteria bacterium]|nr:radical SAM protein [Deltaproteobacteria bacterium]